MTVDVSNDAIAHPSEEPTSHLTDVADQTTLAEHPTAESPSEDRDASTQEEIEANISKANEIKIEGNTFFARAEYESALKQYHAALQLIPKSRAERSVILGNMAACYLKQEKYTKAVETCNEALDIDPDYTKARVRRAQANDRIGSWTALTSALDDYKIILEKEPSSAEAKLATKRLPERITMQQEKEKDEMLSKLKNLGNSLLGKFGLSTDNFQMVPSEGGGYSVNFKK